VRLQLTLASAALVAGASMAHAQVDEPPRATAALRVYADDDRVTVYSPSASATTLGPRDVALDAAVTIDAVSAASIDVVSTASPYAFHEERVEGALGVAVPVARLHRARARATVSHERDYRALRLSAGWRGELAARNVTLDVTFTAGFDTVGRAGDPSFARDRREHRLAVALTQITDPRGYADVVVEAADQRGYLANPYRFVAIEMPTGPAYTLPERVPDERTAIAGLVRVRRALAAADFAHADYRLSRDTWGITSHTASARWTRALSDDEILVGVELRGYLQDAARFHRARYAGDAGAPPWRTRDRSLGAMASLTAGAVAEAVTPWRELRLSVSAAWVRFRWFDDPDQAERDALIASVGLFLPL